MANYMRVQIYFRSGPWDFPGGPVVENLPAVAGNVVQSLVWEDSTYLGANKLRPSWAMTTEPAHCN